jgi:hypothetical protein
MIVIVPLELEIPKYALGISPLHLSLRFIITSFGLAQWSGSASDQERGVIANLPSVGSVP